MNKMMSTREDVKVEMKGVREEMRKNRKEGSKKLKTINKAEKVTKKVMQKVTVKVCMRDRGWLGGASFRLRVVCGISELSRVGMGKGGSCIL